MFDHLAQAKKEKGTQPHSNKRKSRVPQSQAPNPAKPPLSHLKRSAKAYELDDNLASKPQTNDIVDVKPPDEPLRTAQESLFPSNSIASTADSNAISSTLPNQIQPVPQSIPTLTSQPSELPGSGELDDLSAMMFPSADPFAYPKQPMLTLEEFGGQNEALPFSEGRNPFVPAPKAGVSTSYTDDHIEVQMVGPITACIQQQGDLDMGGFGSSATAFPDSDGTWGQQSGNWGSPETQFDDELANGNWTHMPGC